MKHISRQKQLGTFNDTTYHYSMSLLNLLLHFVLFLLKKSGINAADIYSRREVQSNLLFDIVSRKKLDIFLTSG